MTAQLVMFELSMPGVGSWDGKWSQGDKHFVRVMNLRTPPKFGVYRYDFGDGWAAAVTVRECSSAAARKLRRESDGFAGYDWMIDEIIRHGRILTHEERTATKVPA